MGVGDHRPARRRKHRVIHWQSFAKLSLLQFHLHSKGTYKSVGEQWYAAAAKLMLLLQVLLRLLPLFRLLPTCVCFRCTLSNSEVRMCISVLWWHVQNEKRRLYFYTLQSWLYTLCAAGIEGYSGSRSDVCKLRPRRQHKKAAMMCTQTMLC